MRRNNPELHYDRNGNSMLICDMEDDHLLNMIKSVCSKIHDAVYILSQPAMMHNVVISALHPEYNQENMKEKATKVIQFFHQKLQPYVLEASLRGLPITDILQNAYQRTGKISTIINVELFLPEELEVYSEDKF